MRPPKTERNPLGLTMLEMAMAERKERGKRVQRPPNKPKRLAPAMDANDAAALEVLNRNGPSVVGVIAAGMGRSWNCAYDATQRLLRAGTIAKVKGVTPATWRIV